MFQEYFDKMKELSCFVCEKNLNDYKKKNSSCITISQYNKIGSAKYFHLTTKELSKSYHFHIECFKVVAGDAFEFDEK